MATLDRWLAEVFEKNNLKQQEVNTMRRRVAYTL